MSISGVSGNQGPVPLPPRADTTPRSSPPAAAPTGGEAMLWARLFHGAEDPPVVTPAEAGSTGSVYSLLTHDDRTMLAGLYDRVTATGLDPANVDRLAFDLGTYRLSPPESRVDNVGMIFDEQGDPVLFEFTPTDEETSRRILTSKAAGDSAIAPAFLRYLLDPGHQPVHAVDLRFVEHMVYATSPTGSDGSTDPNAVLEPRPRERLAAMYAAGKIPDPADERALRVDVDHPVQEVLAHYDAEVVSSVPLVVDTVEDLLRLFHDEASAQHGRRSPEATRLRALLDELGAAPRDTVAMQPLASP